MTVDPTTRPGWVASCASPGKSGRRMLLGAGAGHDQQGGRSLLAARPMQHGGASRSLLAAAPSLKIKLYFGLDGNVSSAHMHMRGAHAHAHAGCTCGVHTCVWFVHACAGTSVSTAR